MLGVFNLNNIPVYNLVNAGKYVVNRFENVYNFCCKLKLLSRNLIVLIVVVS